jgi:hypothetical protein
MTNTYPEFVKGLFMQCMETNIIHPNVKDASELIDSDLLRLSLYLARCEKIYERNRVLYHDALYTEIKGGVSFVFHLDHMCMHFMGKKMAQVPLPLSLDAAKVAEMAIHIVQQNRQN